MWSTSGELSDVSSPALSLPPDLPVVSEDVVTDSHLNPVFEDTSIDDDAGDSQLQLQVSLNHRGTRVRTQRVRYGYAAYISPSPTKFTEQLSCIVSSSPELHHALTATTGFLPDPRSIAVAISSSVAVSAEISLRSPRKLFIFTIKKICL